MGCRCVGGVGCRCVGGVGCRCVDGGGMQVCGWGGRGAGVCVGGVGWGASVGVCRCLGERV